jgi:uncharacterized membrane protein YhaH (DUF805 family)
MPLPTMLFSFTGRLNRARYWAVSILSSVVFCTLVLLAIAGRTDMMAILDRSDIAAIPVVLVALFLVLLVWIGWAVAAKRLHDRDKSAWWLLLFYFAPPLLQARGHGTGSAALALDLVGVGIGIWALVELGFLRGTTGPNSYGPDPLRAT